MQHANEYTKECFADSTRIDPHPRLGSTPISITHEFAVISRQSPGIHVNKWAIAHNTRVGVVYLTSTDTIFYMCTVCT